VVKCFVAKLPKKTRGNARSVKVPTSLLAVTRRTAQTWFAKPILRATRKALSVPIAKAGFAKAADSVLVVLLVRNAGWRQKNVETVENVCAISATRGARTVVILNAVVIHCNTLRYCISCGCSPLAYNGKVKDYATPIPTISNWQTKSTSTLWDTVQVRGISTGHHSITNGYHITTSNIVAGNPASGFEITTNSGSRYFLGRKAEISKTADDGTS
jgi:hypothetical protein